MYHTVPIIKQMNMGGKMFASEKKSSFRDPIVTSVVENVLLRSFAKFGIDARVMGIEFMSTDRRGQDFARNN